MIMTEKQLTFSPRTHALDNNDNFSPDGKFLCYDTRGTVYNENLANSKSIEKVEIATGVETVLWEPPSVTGEEAAPGVAAASFHPIENKVIFIHGPMLDEVKERGSYNIRNRTALEVDGEGQFSSVKVDRRDVSSEHTTVGAHRGGTHRHEYSRNGKRIGFTYDDYLLPDYDRTIGFMELNTNSPEGYTHSFALILKPVKKGESIAGEIEKAYGDSWIDAAGSKRAFIGKVRAQNGIDYENDLFVAEVPVDVNLNTAHSGTLDHYPVPPEGIVIRRLTEGMDVRGIVRGSSDETQIAFSAPDEAGIDQVFIISSQGSDQEALQLTRLDSPVSSIRWHPDSEWVFYLSDGNVFVTSFGSRAGPGHTIQISNDELSRDQLVVSHDGNLLAYVIPMATQDKSGTLVKDASGNDFRQIFCMELDWNILKSESEQ